MLTFLALLSIIIDLNSIVNALTECNDMNQCYIDVIYDDVECFGYMGCHGARIYGTANCAGYMGCVGAYIYSTEEVSANGELAIFWGLINAPIVYIDGDYSGESAYFDSKGLSEMTVYSRGYHSGDNSAFLCQSGSTCSLICKGTGCLNMYYRCMSGATCNVSCDEDESTDCPDITISLSQEDDIEILKEINNKNLQREIYKKKNLNIEIM